jgi:tetratricopeptide (TPR) repeat protein
MSSVHSYLGSSSSDGTPRSSSPRSGSPCSGEAQREPTGFGASSGVGGVRSTRRTASIWTAVRSLVVVLALLLWGNPSGAQQQGENETEIARQRFREGVAHYDKQEYEKARLAFLQAYMLKPHPAVLLNLAQSELRAGRHAEAAENFAKYIRQNPTAPAMDHAKAGFEEARQRVIELNVQVNASGASISVDGADVGRSPLPNVLYLMPGRHTVLARKGSASAERVLDAVAGRREYIALELREGYAVAPVATPGADGSGAQVAANGQVGADSGGGQGFFSWVGSSPAVVATVTVAGLALGTSAVLAGFANNRYAAANDARGQIMAALETHVAEGYFAPDTVPCGPDGVAGGNVAFDSSLTPVEQQTLVNDYANACNVFNDRSDSGDQLKTLSLVSLGVGAFATIGTIVWYFSDSSGGGSASSGIAPRSARLTPMLSPTAQGLVLDMTF